jgi:hypothetical protein
VCGKGWRAVSVFLPHVLNIHRRISAIERTRGGSR